MNTEQPVSTTETLNSSSLATLREQLEALKALKDESSGKAENLLDLIKELEVGIIDLENRDEDVINPYKVASKGVLQYDVFREKWGLKNIDDNIIKRIEKISGKKVHHWIARQIFYCHIDLDKFLDEYEKGTPCYMYSGRGPSSESMHLGHMLPFLMCLYFQQIFKIPFICQMSDDEKVYAKDIDHQTAYRLAEENAKDIIALGFDPELTWIFSNMKTVGGEFYVNVGKIMKATTLSTVKGIFGFNNSVNMGMYSWFAFQEAPSFNSSFPDVLGNEKAYCIVPLAIDQYPYFRHNRDIAVHHTIKEFKPAVIACKFFPSLTGLGNKMDSSGKSPAVFLTDSPPRIKKAINGSFSGGGDTIEEQMQFGSKLEVDVPYQWLRHFLEDDEELEKIADAYGPPKPGSTIERLTTGQVKARLIEIISQFVVNHQNNRKNVSTEILMKFMSRRKLM